MSCYPKSALKQRNVSNVYIGYLLLMFLLSHPSLAESQYSNRELMKNLFSNFHLLRSLLYRVAVLVKQFLPRDARSESAVLLS